jgi:hypothetical protein
MEVSGQLHAPAALPPGKSPWYPLDRSLGGPQSRSGRGGFRKIPSTRWESNPDRPARSPALYRLSYHDSLQFVQKYILKVTDVSNKMILKMNQNQNVSEKNSIRPRNRCVLILIDGFWIAPE